MAGIAAGVPSVLFPTDLRTEELAQSMFIPYIVVSTEFQAVATPREIRSLVRRTFDAVEFNLEFDEANRLTVLKVYEEILNSAGISLNPEYTIPNCPMTGFPACEM